MDIVSLNIDDDTDYDSTKAINVNAQGKFIIKWLITNECAGILIG